MPASSSASCPPRKPSTWRGRKGLDLIEVSPTAVPPVCRIGDYGRLKYEQSKKDKEARKKQRNWELREVKLRPKIDVHDYEVKAKMAERLLLDGGKVKVTIMFRGREITYTAFGKRLLDRIAKDLENSAIVEREAKLEGKNMFLIMAPRATPLGPPRFVHLKTDTAHHEADTVMHAEEEHERRCPSPATRPRSTEGDGRGSHHRGSQCLRSRRTAAPRSA